ncbi:WYL domain-containing protein [Streptomyces sennicomposti]
MTDAVWRQRRVRVRHRRRQDPQEVTRSPETYGMVLESGRRHLVGGRAEASRIHRVPRIRPVRVLEGGLRPARRLRPAAHWRSRAEE